MLLVCLLGIWVVHGSASSAPSESPTASPSHSPSSAPSRAPSHAPSLSPSSSSPTTSSPNTFSPTTHVPTTSLPTTSIPTTRSPITTSPTSMPQLMPFTPFEPRMNVNSTAVNLTFDLNYDTIVDLPDGTAGFLRQLKGHIFSMMNLSMFPYGPPIDLLNLHPLDSGSVLVTVVMEETYNEVLVQCLDAYSEPMFIRVEPNCKGYLCKFNSSSASEVVYDCPTVGWASRCPKGCVHDLCAVADNQNNKCILGADWDSYTCECLSMGYRTGQNALTCDALDEVSTAGVIAVAVTSFVLGVALMIFFWRRYVLYQRSLVAKEPMRTLARPQRVNTIGRISPVDTSRRLSTPSNSIVAATATPDSSLSSRGRPSTRALTRGPSLAPGSTKASTSKAPSKPPTLDPFKHPYNNKFQQMNFTGEKTKFSRLQAFTVFFSATCALVPSGLGLIIVTTDIVRQEMRYDNLPDCDLLHHPQGKVCLVTMVIEQDMAAPIHFHYRLGGFHQNHRSYVMSRDEKQLRNEDSPDSLLPNCEPLSAGGMFTPPVVTPSFPNPALPPNNFTSATSAPKMKLYPCGLVAQSWFNDVFAACHIVQNETFCDPLRADDWSKEAIIYEWDKQKKFVDRPLRSNESKWNYFLGYPMPSLQDEDFIVWMRVAPKDTFSKFYSEIESTSLRAGDKLIFAIKNNYPTEIFGGTKSLVLSTASFFGGKTTTLGQLYVAVGILSAIFAVVLWLFGGTEAYYHGCCKKSRHSMAEPLGGGIRLE